MLATQEFFEELAEAEANYYQQLAMTEDAI